MNRPLDDIDEEDTDADLEEDNDDQYGLEGIGDEPEVLDDEEEDDFDDEEEDDFDDDDFDDDDDLDDDFEDEDDDGR